MKSRSLFALCSFPSFVALSLAADVAAQSLLYWDGGTSNIATNGNGTSAGGNGTWDSTLQNWDAGASAHVAWSSGKTAVFGGTAGTVTLSGTVSATGITFSSSGYLLTGGTLNHAPASGAFVYTTNGGTNTIADSVAFSYASGTQIQKTGAGTLSLSTGTTGGSGNTATWTITGGTFGSGIFNSILSVGSAARLGTAPASPTPQVVLDAGTLQLTGAGLTNINILGAARIVHVNTAGGAIQDLSTGTSYAAANTINGPIVNNATGSSLYLSNNSGVFSRFTSAISGTGSVTWNGLGTGVFEGSNSYANTIISSGTMQIGGGGTAGTLGSGSVTNNAALSFNRTDNITVGNAIGGTGTVTQSGSGGLVLSAANTYSGGTSVNSGALSIGELAGNSTIKGSNTSLGSGSVNVAASAQLVFAGNNLSIANNVTLNGSATISGRQGALMGGFQDGNSASTLSGTLTLAGTGDRTISTWWSDKTFTLSGKVTGTGNLRIVNASSTGSNGGSIVILSNATNDYSGSTIVDSGGNNSTQTLRLGANNVIPDGAGKGNVTINGRLETQGFNDTINGLGGSGLIVAGAGSTLFAGNNDATSEFSGAFTGTSTSSLRKIGSGMLTLSGSTDNAGARAQVDAGTLVLAKANTVGVRALGSNGGSDFALVITGGTARLGNTGGDQIFQNSAVNMTGGIFDLAGQSEGFDGLSGSGGTITNGTASTTSTLALGQNNSTGSPVFAGVIQNGAGTVALVKTGTGTQTLGGTNSYSGGTSLTEGTLAVANDNALGTGALTMSAGTTLGNFNNVAHTLANNIAFGATATLRANSDLTLNGGLSGGASGAQIGVQGAGVLTISNNGHNLGTSAAPAVWTVSAGGTLAASQGNNLGNLPATATTQLILDNGTFKTITANGTFFSTRGMQINGGGGTWLDSAGGVSIDGAVVNNGAFAVNTAVANATSSLKGVISGSGSLSKSGDGTLVLSGENLYSGATTVTAGKLVVNGNISTSVTTTVSGTGILGGSGTVGALVATAGGTIAPGNSPGILQAGNLDLQSGSALDLEINGAAPGTEYDQLRITGTVTLAGTPTISLGFTPVNGDLFFILLNDSNDAINGTFSGLADGSAFSVGSQDFRISYFGDSATNSFTGGNDVVLMAIPEPGAALLGGLGLMVLLRRRR